MARTVDDPGPCIAMLQECVRIARPFGRSSRRPAVLIKFWPCEEALGVGLSTEPSPESREPGLTVSPHPYFTDHALKSRRSPGHCALSPRCRLLLGERGQSGSARFPGFARQGNAAVTTRDAQEGRGLSPPRERPDPFHPLARLSGSRGDPHGSQWHPR